MNRGAIITLSDGSRVRMNLELKQPIKYIDQFEREFVENFNRAQPHLANKVVDCHIMRR